MKNNQNFNFGVNWKNYSDKAFNLEKFNAAKNSLLSLFPSDAIPGSTFLDIGSGSGVFSIAAKGLGATKILGIDISKESVDTAKSNLKKLKVSGIEFLEKSILDDDYLRLGQYDIVYSWGVLHHTGHMYDAIRNSSDLVNEKGMFVISIYNRHWSSFGWKIVKFIYNRVPKFVQKLMICVFYVIILIAKFLVTFKNPFKKDRGMNFYYDVIDWVGGYPYEYATKKEIKDFVENLGFAMIEFRKAKVPTGCNEFVFQKQ